MQHAGRQESTQHRHLGARHDQDGRWAHYVWTLG
jgi:hypothetical protein